MGVRVLVSSYEIGSGKCPILFAFETFFSDLPILLQHLLDICNTCGNMWLRIENLGPMQSHVSR
jgi:hypothetical protein